MTSSETSESKNQRKIPFTQIIFTYFQKLVCKVDQLVKRRAKSGLIRVNVDWNEAKEFIQEHLGKEIKVCLPFCLL